MADNYTDATDTDFKAENYNIDEGKKLSAEGMRAALHTKEKVANKTDVINSSNNSSNAQYPSVKAVYTLDGGAVHKAGAETITGVKTFGAADTVAEPKLGAAKTTDAANDGTKFATEAQVYAVKSAIGSKQDGLPVGTILLFDGAGWRDNATLPGWYSCNRTNYNNGLTPDLEDKFIKGKGALADTGGSNALTAAMLPRHAHSITTTATNKTLTGSIRAVPTDEGAVCSGIISASKWDTEFGYKEEEAPVNQISIDARHEHTGNANNDNSSVTDTNTSNLPLYYSLIYIRRCA